ncbi:MAG: hypothetical protein ACO3BE_04330, partial [Gemmobacter sp.]
MHQPEFGLVIGQRIEPCRELRKIGADRLGQAREVPRALGPALGPATATRPAQMAQQRRDRGTRPRGAGPELTDARSAGEGDAQ